jgi:hypothetical protein
MGKQVDQSQKKATVSGVKLRLLSCGSILAATPTFSTGGRLHRRLAMLP